MVARHGLHRFGGMGQQLDRVAQHLLADLEDLAEAIELTVEENKASILLVFVDVIEHQGRHIRSFYETMGFTATNLFSKHIER